ncbi:MAG: helix-turn-helix domain-containing GNAT family N-acetyltransferase [Acidimicrobiia bacterium]|nr:helix-turn-helix domain-containing GNAT family N-acetyltransferase [Acidimicrobiia bacterium]
MTGTEIDAIRSFNRTVTERIGALDDWYLSRDRPLGASRLLWEVGADGADVRTLRSGLGLDSGYLSRLLRSLEREGLVDVTPAPSDRRVRRVRPTRAGRAERALLDRRSDDLARSLLDSRQRSRLVDAARVVEHLLTAGLVHIDVEDPSSDVARFCIGSYFAELDRRFDSGFDPEQSISADAAELTEPAGILLVARLRDEPVGCGALKLRGTGPAEIKRMWVAESARGLGLGRRLLHELEDRAYERGVAILRLETNRALTEAIGLYRSAGYEEVEAFNDEPFAHHWFEKPALRHT